MEIELLLVPDCPTPAAAAELITTVRPRTLARSAAELRPRHFPA
jgi:hypothetical protein